MSNIDHIVALLRKHDDLEIRIINGSCSDAATERQLEDTRRALTTHPLALNAVLRTAYALRRTPDTVSAQDVANCGWTN